MYPLAPDHPSAEEGAEAGAEIRIVELGEYQGADHDFTPRVTVPPEPRRLA